MSTVIIEGEAFEDSSVSLMRCITGPNGVNITQASISSITYKVFDLDDTSEPTATGSLTVSSVVFDTLQTDARWTKDSIGYNFRWDTPAALLEDGNKVYRFEIKFTTTAGEVFPVVFHVSTVGLYGS